MIRSLMTYRKLYIYHRPIKILFATFLSVIGGLLYLIFRSDNLIMFSWFNSLKLTDFIINLRNTYGNHNIYEWTKLNLPAGLWLFSYLLIMDTIWKKEDKIFYPLFISFLPLIALISEFMQLVHVIPGTFDIMDLLSYGISIALFILVKKL